MKVTLTTVVVHFEHTAAAHRAVMRARRLRCDALLADAGRLGDQYALRRHARLGAHRHVVVERNVDDQPVAEQDEGDGQDGRPLPVEGQSDPVGNADDNAGEDGNGDDKKLWTRRTCGRAFPIKCRHTECANSTDCAPESPIYRSQDVRVVVDDPDNRLHADIGHIALAQVVIVQQRAEADFGVLVPVQHAIAGKQKDTGPHPRDWFVCKQMDIITWVCRIVLSYHRFLGNSRRRQLMRPMVRCMLVLSNGGASLKRFDDGSIQEIIMFTLGIRVEVYILMVSKNCVFCVFERRKENARASTLR